MTHHGGPPPPPAQLWHALDAGRVACELCYRRCELDAGDAGWCGHRRNEGGRMALPYYGELARLQRLTLGYGGGLRTFCPGLPALGVGATHCTARCSFCTSADIVWRPGRLPWARGAPRRWPAPPTYWMGVRAMAYPENIVAAAKAQYCGALVFSENEPLLSYELTYETAKLARAEGLKVVIYTNGSSTVEAVEQLAPYVDAVEFGLKGSLDPAYYDRYMRAAGAVDQVKASAQAWRAAGVHLLLSDLIPTPHQQPDPQYLEARARLHAWVAAALGEHTPILIGHMHPPDALERDDHYWITPRGERTERYQYRWFESAALWHAAGLPYAHRNQHEHPIRCHSCDGVLIDIRANTCRMGPDDCELHTTGCTCWSHAQHVTAGRCDHCAAAVPLAVMTPREVEGWRLYLQRRADERTGRQMISLFPR